MNREQAYRVGYQEWPVGMALADPSIGFRDLMEVPADEVADRNFEIHVFDDDENDVAAELLSDISWAAPGVLSFATHLWDFASSLEAKGCRLARFTLGGEVVRLLVLPVLTVDLFDMRRAEFDRFPSSGRIMHVKEWALKPPASPLPPLFRVAVEDRPSVEVFASEEFRLLYAELGASGLTFREVEQTS